MKIADVGFYIEKNEEKYTMIIYYDKGTIAELDLSEDNEIEKNYEAYKKEVDGCYWGETHQKYYDLAVEVVNDCGYEIEDEA